MNCESLQAVCDELQRRNLIRLIDEPLDIELEIPHVAYLEVKQGESKALLFTHPVSKRLNREFDVPVLMNVFGSFEVTELIFNRSVQSVANQISTLLHLRPPSGILQKLSMASELFSLKNVFPKRLDKRGDCQAVVLEGDAVNLYDLPILTTWEQDGGPFITMGQVYTQSLDGTMHNVGMYRLQLYDKNHLGLHWQIHKDASHFFDQYQKEGKKMPVSIAIGGDPLLTWCATAPLPYGVNELLLYGFIRNQPAKTVRSITNPLYIPNDADYVIEGWVDPLDVKIEGPFGDHTGYYTLEEPYPVLEVSAITSKKEPIFLATVVGKPPLEDKYMGWATERIFLPLLQSNIPDLIDYHMPENGVFHNLILAKMKTLYKGHALQFMHAFWGAGQMSFVKHALFLDESAPQLTNYDSLMTYILNRFDSSKLFFSEGITDALDHAANESLVGSKLGVDLTSSTSIEAPVDILSDEDLFSKILTHIEELQSCEQLYRHTKNPITILRIQKQRNYKAYVAQLLALEQHVRVVVIVDAECNGLNNGYMTLWRVVNNLDAKRDIMFNDSVVIIDGTNKSSIDGFEREWPSDVLCSKEVLNRLRSSNVIDIDEAFIEKYGIL